MQRSVSVSAERAMSVVGVRGVMVKVVGVGEKGLEDVVLLAVEETLGAGVHEGQEHLAAGVEVWTLVSTHCR